MVGSAFATTIAAAVEAGTAGRGAVVEAALGLARGLAAGVRGAGRAETARVSWLTNFVRPKLQALVRKTEVPDNLWTKCPACEQMIFHRELEERLKVCPHCEYHFRMGAAARLAMLFDDGAYRAIEIPETTADPLRFRDRRRYADRLKDAQSESGHKDAIIVAHGTLGDLAIVAAALEFDFMGGSMGMAVGEALIAAGRLAVLQKAPLVVVPASGGARMQEGILSLMQMPRTVIAVQEVREAGLPYVVVLADPTMGGVSASFAMLGDVSIAEPGATVGFAGARVIEDTIREKPPDGFQSAESLLEHGMVDLVVHRRELRAVLIRILRLLVKPLPPAEVVRLPKGDGEAPRTLLQPRS